MQVNGQSIKLITLIQDVACSAFDGFTPKYDVHLRNKRKVMEVYRKNLSSRPCSVAVMQCINNNAYATNLSIHIIMSIVSFLNFV